MITRKQVRREAKHLFRLCLVDGLLDENRVREVVRSAAAAGHREGPAILAQFLRLVKLDRAQHTASIETATPLEADLQSAIEAGLARRYGAGLSVTAAHRPSLIGGMRIQVGCDVYDTSVQAKLASLEKNF